MPMVFRLLHATRHVLLAWYCHYLRPEYWSLLVDLTVSSASGWGGLGDDARMTKNTAGGTEIGRR